MMAVATAGRAGATATLRSYLSTSVSVWAGSVGLLTLLLRLVGLGRSQDIFVDEPIYVALGHSVRSGGFPMVGGERFFLHPPAFFYLEAIWERLFGYRPDVVGGIYEMRALNAMLAGATAVALILLVARVSSLRPAVATGALFALEPFCVRQNGRVLLETAMMFWAVAGYVVLLPLAKPSTPTSCGVRAIVDRQGASSVTLSPLTGSGARSGDRTRAVCVGLLFGLAVLTKDEAALITVVPLVAAAALRWGPRRRLVLLAAGVATLPYVAYLAAVVAAGHWAEFWTAKTTGALRLLGLLQQSGFNAPGAPSLGARLVHEWPSFATTYALVAVSSVALVLLVRRGSSMHRVLALFYASAALALAYALLIGTLEEQALYVLVVPGLAAVGVAAPLAYGQPADHAARRRVTFLLLALVLLVNVNTYVKWRLRPDDGFAELRQYMATHVPSDSAVIAADPLGGDLGGAFHVLAGRYRMVPWVSRQEQAREKARYLIVPWKDVDDGYSYLSAQAVRRLTDHAARLFSLRGRTYTLLALYRLPLPVQPRPGRG